VTSLIAGRVTDADPGALQGIAVTAVNDGNGVWQYSTNGGATWSAFGIPSEGCGAVASKRYQQLCAVRANANWNGPVANGLTFRAWDQTTGAAGGTEVTRSSGTMLDTFSAVAYTNNNGTDAWSGNWVDIDGSAVSGSIFVGSPSGTLAIKAQNTTDWIYREANLSGVTSAMVSFNYDSPLNTGTGGRVDFQVSNDGGTNYTILATFSDTNNFESEPSAQTSAPMRLPTPAYASRPPASRLLPS